MLEALERFLALFGARPLFLTLAVLALLAFSRSSSRRWNRAAARALGAAGLAGLAAYGATMVWYAAEPHFFDYAEPSLIAVGWLFHLGQPIYHLPDSAARYSHIYGPFAFMIHGYALAAFGPGILVSKGISAAAAAAAVACTYAAVRRHAGTVWATALCGQVALALMAFKNFSYWTRPEPFQLLAVGMALLLAVRGQGSLAAVGVGLASGVLWNLKITGPLYVLPILALLRERSGWRGLATACTVAAAAAALPFLIFANVSLANYLFWLERSASTGLMLSTLRQNLEWTAYFAVPVLLSYYAVPPAARRRERGSLVVISALVAGMAGIAVAAAKPGAGPYHLMPFLPVIAYVAARQTSGFDVAARIDPWVSRTALAFAAAAAIVAMVQQTMFVAAMVDRRTHDEAGDIEQFARAHDGAIGMAYGESEALSLMRPLLVFRSNAYLIDQPAVREHQLSGIDVPGTTVDAIARCDVRYWLVPRGEAPFSGRNVYAAVAQRDLYPEALRRTFLQTHTRVGETRYFDVWRCRTANVP